MKSCVCFLLLLFPFSGITQNLEFQVEVKESFRKTDLFTEIDVKARFGKWQPLIGTGFGTLKTLRQFRYFPEVYTGCNFSIIDHKKIQLGIRLQTHFSQLTYNQSEKARIHYIENLVGYDFSVGEKWKFSHQFLVGSLHEHFSSTPISSFHPSFNYHFSIGLAYVI